MSTWQRYWYLWQTDKPCWWSWKRLHEMTVEVWRRDDLARV
jgi:hypothetical protein